MPKTCSACGRPLKDNVFVGGKIKNGVCKSPVCKKFGKPS
jgi:hypothetical protein